MSAGLSGSSWGRDTGLRDISVDKVSVNQTAFEDAPVTIQAAVTASGFPASNIRAQLTEVATESGDRSAKTNDDAALAASNFPS